LKTITEAKNFYATWSKSAKPIFKNKRFSLLEKDDFHVVEYHKKQVIVLPILEDHSIIMPKVKRHILGEATWELPAGGIKDGESEEEGALRELREETGILIFDTSRLNKENTLIVSQNRLPMFPSIFSIEVTVDEFEQRNQHDHEVESVRSFTFDEIKELISTGQIFTSITISILARFLLSREIASN
jgi:8-oxo-dGTP pyrophosphatase MutT (NUDIX family)